MNHKVSTNLRKIDSHAQCTLTTRTGTVYRGRGKIERFNQSGGTALQDVRHTWDAAGNLVTRQDLLTSETETFTYDFLDRLLSASSGNYSESYTYNQISNILTRNGVSYTYGAKPHAVTSVGSANYTYDANGNMLTRGGQTFTWDAENRLVSVSQNSTTTTFVYDGDGKRVKKMENGDTVLYVNQYYEKNLTTGNVTSSYYLGSRLVATKENNVLRYVHQDHLAGTSLMTDSSGAKIGTTMKYLPFGETLAGTVPTDKKFTGQRLDATGLYYYNARYYDATIGRFISPDTVIQKPANPQTINRYAYSLNNPLKYVDPTGHIVKIGGWDIRTIDAMIKYPNSPWAPLTANVVASPSYQAYNTIRSVDTYYTSRMENSTTINLNITTGDCKGASATTASDSTDTKITLTLDTAKSHSLDEHVADMCHEFVHVFGKMIDPLNNVPDSSKFEENLGDVYAAGVCKIAGLTYNSPYILDMSSTSLNNKYTGWSPYENYSTFPLDRNRDAAINFMMELASHPVGIYAISISPYTSFFHSGYY